MKVRIKFWYQGSTHKSKHSGTVDLDIDIEQYLDDEAFIETRADEALSDAIVHGLIDSACDAGINDFGVMKIYKKIPKRKPDFKL